MKATAFRLAMDDIAASTRFAVHTKSMLLKTVLAAEGLRNAERTIAAAIKGEVLMPLCRGVYVHKYALPGVPILQEAVRRLRPRHFNYLSLETALGAWGVIDQQPLSGITVMTSGRSQLFATPHGRIDFTHTDQRYANVAPELVAPEHPSGLPMAKARQAARDQLRVRRNVDLIDWDEYRAILETA